MSRPATEGWRELVGRALEEDLGSGDLTSEATVPAGAQARARIVQKQPGVLFGCGVASEAFRRAGAGHLERLVDEGEWNAEVPLDVAVISAQARAILAAERVALNLLGRLSGIATLTARHVAAAAEGGPATILDTRKTTPGLRELEKAAVRAGGGRSHRSGLYDAILIKENHIVLAGGVGPAVERARAAHRELAIEVECRDLAEVEQALAAGADRILLDNMGPEGLAAAVAARGDRERAGAGRAELEASGGVTLESVAAIAASGVDFISVGALTHSAPALDLSLLLEPL